MIQGTASFPTIKSGDGGAAGTMEHNGLATPTNCQDTLDTAGYWQPEPYLNGSPWLPGGGCSTNCSANTDLYLRVYYLPDAQGIQQEIPDGSIMVRPALAPAASAPSASINLSFACGHGGDPNCTTDTGQTGCGSATGHCFIGANPVGWEALYADYWQTWQEGGGTDTFPESSQGSFPDLVEDCSNEGQGACSFIITSTQQPSPRVFGNPEST